MHGFQSTRFDKLLLDSGRLVAEALDHERDLTEIVERLVQSSASVPAVLDATYGAASTDLLTSMRRLSAAAREQRQLAESVHSGLKGDPTYAADAGPKRPVVLVVDDAEDIIETTTLFLELSGFRTISARNGLEALIAAHYARPRVAVLDVKMPVLDGIETARLLKASPVTQQIRLVAYTAVQRIEEQLQQFFERIVLKPVSADAFLSVVQQLTADADGAPA